MDLCSSNNREHLRLVGSSQIKYNKIGDLKKKGRILNILLRKIFQL